MSDFSAYSYHRELTKYQLAVGSRFSGSFCFKIFMQQYSPSQKYAYLSRPEFENLSLTRFFRLF